MSVSILERPPAVQEEEARQPRDPEFGRRLTKVADDDLHCPPMGLGRVRWVQDEMKKRYDVKVSRESISKWFSGENKPRPLKIAFLAQLFGVDVPWLQLGIDSGMRPRDIRMKQNFVSGAVNVVAGMIALDGGHPAFPEEGDERADKEGIDLYAIIRGANYSISVSHGEQEGEGFVFSAPYDHDNLVVLGLVRTGFSFRVFELLPDVIKGYGRRRGATYEVKIGNVDDDLKEITTFANRL